MESGEVSDAIVIAIDPGTVESAYVAFDGHRVIGHGIEPNVRVAGYLRRYAGGTNVAGIVLEQIESFGMAVGREVFETVFWTGRLFQVARDTAGPERVSRMPRRAVKLHLCGSMKAKDPNIRVALMDRFGGERAKGTKYAQGPLYGISSHEWSALAIAVTWWDTERERQQPMKEQADASETV